MSDFGKDYAAAMGDRFIPVDLAHLESDMNPTRYAIEPLVPRGYVTLIGSHGGAGKSILALTLSAHVVCGRHWCGLPVYQGKALYVSLEDPGELARYRLRRIADEYDLEPSTIAEGLTVLDGSNTDSVLATEMNDSGVKRLLPTAAMEELKQASEGKSLIVIDNASDAYDANENDRRMVRTFVRDLSHIARNQDAAVVLLAHIDKAAARHGANGNLYSGSTAWHNSTRSRLALTDSDGIELAHEKNNLGKRIENLCLTWTDTGVLVPMSSMDTVSRDQGDDEAVLKAIESAIQSGATVHAARSGSHSTLSVLKTYPELPKHLREPARFWQALTRLERASQVKRETYTNEHRKKKERLIVRRASPHTPERTGARSGRATAPVPNLNDWRTTGALAHCPKCDNAGCAWCRPRA